ncbi:MAG TPA: alpha/beta hydrolase family protein [Candidatus Brocadiia bacterium]|nr:alpha/beta hydrolase family protein [Candidatus Brocadiia bacterium]
MARFPKVLPQWFFALSLLALVASPVMCEEPAAAATGDADTATAQTLDFSGVVSAKFTRPMKPGENAEIQKLLKTFENKPEDFKFEATLKKTEKYYDCFDVRFPSPYKSPYEENNTVWCEYYRTKEPGKQPGIIVLHILDGNFIECRILCHALARNGCNAIMVKMAYYGERRPKDKNVQNALTANADAMMKGLIQTVQDVRRTAAFLASQDCVDPERIGICGISLGAFVTGLTAGVDGNFPRAVMMLGGGDPAGMVMHGPKEIQGLADKFKAEGYTYETLDKKFKCIAPKTFASRIPPGSLVMLNGSKDEVVPPENSKVFWNHTKGQREIIWYDCTHYSAVKFIDNFTRVVNRYFGPNYWKSGEVPPMDLKFK